MQNMKPLKVCLFTIAVAGVVLVLRSQPTAQPSNTSNASQDGRYRLVVANDTYGIKELVIDTQSGRVWRYIFDKENNVMVFYPCWYENAAREVGAVPNETLVQFNSKNNAGLTQTNQQAGAFDELPPKLEQQMKEHKRKLDEDASKLFPAPK